MTRKHLWAVLALGTLGLAACSDGGPTGPSGSAPPPSFSTTVKPDSTSRVSSPLGAQPQTSGGYAVAW